MATLTEQQLAWLHSEVGAGVTDAELQETYDRLGSTRDVAIEVLRDRRATLLSQPLQTSVSGVASVSYAQNVPELTKRIEALTHLDDDPSDNVGDEADGGSGEPVLERVPLTRSRKR